MRTFVKSYPHWDEIVTLDVRTGYFKSQLVDNSIGNPFGTPMISNAIEMGYKDGLDMHRQLCKRGHLGVETPTEKQKESERLGLINLGVYRIKHYVDIDNVVNCSRIEDICNKLQSNYGMSYTDAQNQIITLYEHSL